MSAVFKRGRARIEANLTPMIDVTFLLIVFFVLVSQIVEVESVPMSLPEPEHPVTQRAGDEQRAVINVMPGYGGGIEGYRLGTSTYPPGPPGLTALRRHLESLYRANPQISVNLRADRSSHYEQVEPVLQAVSDAAGNVPEVQAAARVNLVVITER